jgi:hypothetical protein
MKSVIFFSKRFSTLLSQARVKKREFVLRQTTLVVDDDAAQGSN